MNDEMMEEIITELVVNGGDARSKALEALKAAREKDFEKAEELLKLSDESILRAHEFQTNLIQSALNMESEEESYASLLMVHGQDHLMDAMVVRDLAKEMLEMYRMIAELKKAQETA